MACPQAHCGLPEQEERLGQAPPEEDETSQMESVVLHRGRGVILSSWASLVAQRLKCLSAMRETWV